MGFAKDAAALAQGGADFRDANDTPTSPAARGAAVPIPPDSSGTGSDIPSAAIGGRRPGAFAVPGINSSESAAMRTPAVLSGPSPDVRREEQVEVTEFFGDAIVATAVLSENLEEEERRIEQFEQELQRLRDTISLSGCTQPQRAGLMSFSICSATSQTTGGNSSRVAVVPAVARGILSAMAGRILLPRNDEVDHVLDSVLDETRPEAAVAACSESDGDEGRDGGINSAPGDISQVSSHGNGGNRNESHTLPSQTEAFDTTKFITFIQGIGGIGKTTLAAMLISRRDVRSRFHDGICWIRLGQHKPTKSAEALKNACTASSAETSQLTYGEYRDHLSALCRQLNVSPPQFDEVVLMPGDDERIQEEKTLRAMENAMQDMANILDGSSVLLVLDDLWHESDLRWFEFANCPESCIRLLVTTRVLVGRMHRFQQWDNTGCDGSSSQTSKEMFTKLGALREEEAVQILLTEATPSGCPSDRDRDWTCDEKRHALTIVRCCNCLPVAVRSVGRLLSAAVSDHDVPFGGGNIAQLASEMKNGDYSILGAFEVSNENDADLFSILDQYFSSDLHGHLLSDVMKLCFTTFATCFMRGDCNRPWVPITAIHILWDSFLTTRERSVLECDPSKTLTAQLLEKMEMLGLVDSMVATIGQRTTHGIFEDTLGMSTEVIKYRVHHDMMLQYARHNWEHSTALKFSKFHRRIHKVNASTKFSFSDGAYLCKGTRGNEPSNSNSLLHSLVARGYKKRRAERPDQPWIVAVPDDGYIYKHLPYHMIKAGGKKMLKEAFLLLREEGFIMARMTSVGAIKATNLHIQDVEMLKQRFNGSNGGRKEQDFKNGQALFSFGFLDSEALLTFDSVRSFLKNQLSPKESTSQQGFRLSFVPEEVGESLVDIGASLQRQNLWIQALDTFAEALELFKALNLADDHPVIKLAHLHAKSSALPKLILVSRDSPQCIKLKNAPKLRELASSDSNIDVVSKGNEGVSLELSSHPGLGIVLTRPHSAGQMGSNMYELGVGPKESAVHVSPRGELLWRHGDNTVLGSFEGCYEGDSVFLSPFSYVDMAAKQKWPGSFGWYRFVVNSDGTTSPIGKPNLALGIGPFPLMLVPRNSPTRFILKHGKALREHQPAKVGHKPSGEEGLPLELCSHPGYAITVQISLPLNVGPIRMNLMGMGQTENAVRVSYDGRIISCSEDGTVFALQGPLYGVGVPVFLMRGNMRMFTRWKGGANDFVINEEGSISPKHAPHLAVGCASLGRANDIITREEKLYAEAQSKLKPTQKIKGQTLRKMWLGFGFATQFQLSNFRVDKM